MGSMSQYGGDLYHIYCPILSAQFWFDDSRHYNSLEMDIKIKRRSVKKNWNLHISALFSILFVHNHILTCIFPKHHNYKNCIKNKISKRDSDTKRFDFLGGKFNVNKKNVKKKKCNIWSYETCTSIFRQYHKYLDNRFSWSFADLLM